MTTLTQEILEPFNYICSNPGKNIRSILINAFQRWLQVPSKALDVITEVIDMLHNSSLMVDDIQDGSTLRRGQPVAHMIYGIPQTLNCANMVYFISLQKLCTLNNPDLVRIFSDELVNLHNGQGLDLYWRENLICPNESEYIQMINFKTGGLLRLAVKLMQAFSDKKENYITLVNLVGIHFQIRDDYINLISSEFQNQKGFCEDLTEGKFSFPAIHHLTRTDNPQQFLNILKQKTTNLDLKQFAVKLIQSTGSFDYTKIFLIQKEMEILEEIERLGGNVMLSGLVQKLKVEKIDTKIN